MNAFRVENINKSFGKTIALRDVNFSCEIGETHGLIGENGAGKSTLIKILCGVHKPDAGEVYIHEKKVDIRSPLEGSKNDVSVVHQELSLISDLTVAQNLFLPKQPSKRFGIVSNKHIENLAEKEFAQYGINDIDVRKKINKLNLRDQQIIEIIKAILHKAHILVLDEPTSALGVQDVEWLYDIIRNLNKKEIAIVYISHRINEIRDLCKNITVLRNGINVGTEKVSDISNAEIVNMMIGKQLEKIFPEKIYYADKENKIYQADDVSTKKYLKNLNFSIAKGEVLGIAALQGQGQEELFKTIFGDSEISKGRIYIEGKETKIKSPLEAIKNGIGLIPEERKTEGLIMELSIRDNATFCILNEIKNYFLIDLKKENKLLNTIFSKLKIDLKKTKDLALSLSGGNQQKLVFAKWLLTDSKLFLMYDPTRGVDIGTKAEIYKIIRNLAQIGKSVLLYSSELSEVLELSDRILVIYNGKIKQEFKGNEIIHENILSSMLGMKQESE